MELARLDDADDVGDPYDPWAPILDGRYLPSTGGGDSEDSLLDERGGLAIDERTSTLYVGSYHQGRIYRMGLDGSDQTVVYDGGANSVSRLAIDKRGNLYWLNLEYNGTYDAVHRASLDVEEGELLTIDRTWDITDGDPETTWDLPAAARTFMVYSVDYVLDTSALTHTSEAEETTSFTVALDTEPTSDVNVLVESSDTSEGTVSPGVLTFTTENWATPQTVTVTGVHDFDEDGDVSFEVTLLGSDEIEPGDDDSYSNVSTSVAIVNDDVQCAEGEYDDGTATCIACSCDAGEYPTGGCDGGGNDYTCQACTAITGCEPGYVSCMTAEDQECSMCIENYYLNDASCVECSSACEEGTYLSAECDAGSDRVCTACDESCATCDGPNADDCVSCNAPLVLSGGMCSQDEDPGTGQDAGAPSDAGTPGSTSEGRGCSAGSGSSPFALAVFMLVSVARIRRRRPRDAH